MEFVPSQNGLWHDTHIIGDVNGSVKLRRACVPKEDMKNFFERFKQEVSKLDMFEESVVAGLSGIGSTRQYLEEDFQKPYAGDLDLITKVPALQQQLDDYIKTHVIPKLKEANITYTQLFGNISLFVPVKQQATEEQLFIQVDIMFAPNEGDACDFMKQVRYFSGEPYKLIDGQYYLKGVHTALLLEKILQAKGFLMDNVGIYREKYIPVRNDDIKNLLQDTMQGIEKTLKKSSKKFDQHKKGIETRLQDTFPLTGRLVTPENKSNLLPDQKILYEEIEKCLVIREYEQDFVGFLKDSFEWDQVTTLSQGLNVLLGIYEMGIFCDEEIQSLFSSYAQRLQEKKKGVLWFPQLEKMICEKFPFVSFVANK